MKAFKKLIWKLLNILGCGWFVQLGLKSGLKENGWIKSFGSKRSQDAEGNPVPWLTYSFMHFITPRLKKEFRIAEFGSGFSSVWWAQRVTSVYSVEHNQEWATLVQNEMKNRSCENATVVYRTQDVYAKGLEGNAHKFDLILVDGIERNSCLQESINFLTPGGVIVLDNSELKDYTEGKALLERAGFKRIDFFGSAPIVAHFTTTTLFYRDGNCLGV